MLSLDKIDHRGANLVQLGQVDAKRANDSALATTYRTIVVTGVCIIQPYRRRCFFRNKSETAEHADAIARDERCFVKMDIICGCDVLRFKLRPLQC